MFFASFKDAHGNEHAKLYFDWKKLQLSFHTIQFVVYLMENYITFRISLKLWEKDTDY